MPWNLLTASVQGAAHLAAAMPNQDAVGSRGESGSGGAAALAVAVADGHGDPRHFRSGRGSRFAAEVACALGCDVLGPLAGAGPEAVRAQLDGRLLPAIVEGWRAAVAEDLAHHPFSAQELGHRQPGDDALVAYGSTLLLAVCAGPWLALAQIGDGDMLLVGADGAAATPVPSDPALHGRFTTSLCQDDALVHFRTAVLDVEARAVEVLLLATDGFGNAQATEPWQPGVGADLLQFVRQRGLAWMAEQLPAWAARCASAEGSGDDTTLALLVRSAPGLRR